MKRTFISFRLVGGAYKRGFYYSGFTQLIDDKGETLYFREEISLNEAIAQAKAQGHNVAPLVRKLDEWQKTGKGVSFSLQP